MSYYQGDYYQGGFFSFIGRGIKAVAGLAGLGGGTKTIIQQVPAVGPSNPILTSSLARLGTRATALVRGHPVLSAAAAAGIGALGLGAAAGAAARGRGRVHPAVAAAMGIHKKHKRMNPYNPRALRRAVRRAHAFAKMARKILRFTSPKPPKGRPFFKHRKRKA